MTDRTSYFAAAMFLLLKEEGAVTSVEKNRGGRPPKTGSAARPVSERPPTLASFGITKDQSYAWR
jgi:hypothetical protein